MLSRCLALLIVPTLPFLPLMLPLGHAHAVNALVAGVVATALALFSLVDDRARIGVAAIGAWVALTAFLFPSTLLDEIVVVSWGVTTFAFMAGPLSSPPRRARVAAVEPSRPPVVEDASPARAPSEAVDPDEIALVAPILLAWRGRGSILAEDVRRMVESSSLLPAGPQRSCRLRVRVHHLGGDADSGPVQAPSGPDAADPGGADSLRAGPHSRANSRTSTGTSSIE